MQHHPSPVLSRCCERSNPLSHSPVVSRSSLAFSYSFFYDYFAKFPRLHLFSTFFSHILVSFFVFYSLFGLLFFLTHSLFIFQVSLPGGFHSFFYLFSYPRRKIAQGVECRADKTEVRRLNPVLSVLVIEVLVCRGCKIIALSHCLWVWE